jgi:hypothetical protein
MANLRGSVPLSSNNLIDIGYMMDLNTARSLGI